jgi:hypothetical protein
MQENIFNVLAAIGPRMTDSSAPVVGTPAVATGKVKQAANERPVSLLDAPKSRASLRCDLSAEKKRAAEQLTAATLFFAESCPK